MDEKTISQGGGEGAALNAEPVLVKDSLADAASGGQLGAASVPPAPADGEIRSPLWELRMRWVSFVIASLSFGVALSTIASPEILVALSTNVIGVVALSVGVIAFIAHHALGIRHNKRSQKTFLDIDKEVELIIKNKAQHRGSDFRDLYESPSNDEFYWGSEEELPFSNSYEPNILKVPPFVAHCEEVLDYIDARIKLSEQKASMLLDKGTSYLIRGIYFFVASIVFWQLVMFGVGFQHYMWFGIVSCSLTFLVIEFLAAWFLKQYRSYVDTTVVFLRVRSTFSRYLLSFHALVDSEQELITADTSRAALLKALEYEVKWPDDKDLNANDFNFMLESMNSFTSVFERLKAALDSGKKAG